MHTVRATEARRTETPNATMTTLASPSLGATDALSLWQVEMEGGARGPVHSFDSEQVWTVTTGEIVIETEGGQVELSPGDTVVLPPGVDRQVIAARPARALVCGFGNAVAHAASEPEPRGTPPWIA